jgi:hypothetical protein
MMSFCDVLSVVLLLVILVIVVHSLMKNKKSGMQGWMEAESDQPIPNLTQPSEYNWNGYVAKDPYGVLNLQLDALRGQYGPSLGRDSRFANGGLSSFYRNGQFMRPRDYELLNRVSWFDSPSTKGIAVGVGMELPPKDAPVTPVPRPPPIQPGETETAIEKKEGFGNVGLMVSDEADISDAAAIGVADAAARIGMRTCNPDPNAEANDYGAYMRSLIADDRMLANHAAWAKEVQPFSQTSIKINDFDIEPYVDFIGLRRPQAVAVYNPTQLTELAPEDLSPNKKFEFQG